VNLNLVWFLFSGAALLASIVVSDMTSVATTEDEAPFLTENNAAMTKMMTAMDIKPSGDADADFVAMMVPHHQGAIDMAQAQLRHGHNEQLTVTQKEEIAAMRLALGRPLPPSKPSLTQQPSSILPTAASARP
jgi:hypothetical protein